MSISDSRAAEASVQVKGKDAKGLAVWLRTKRAFTSKGRRRAMGAGLAVFGAERAERVKWDADDLTAKAERRADSLAVTGLIQPWSSVDPKLVRPAPVRASGPVQTKCCVEGERGPRRWFKFNARGLVLISLESGLGVPETLSMVGRPGA